MNYDPFARGAAPVGIHTLELEDSRRGGPGQTIEIWYPATESMRNAEAAAGRFPLVMYNHGAFGHRRGHTVLCTHLASHGYVIASNDVHGDSTSDRMSDASLVIERLVAGADPLLAGRIDGTRVGACGETAGGWTTLGLNAVNRRMAASFAIEPLCGRQGGVRGSAEILATLRLDDWGRPIPTFVLAGDGDPLVNLDDLRDLYAKLRAPKRFAILRGGGHWHFTDDYPASYAADTQRALCLAHMDAHLRGNEDAFVFLDRDLAGTFAARGIRLEVARPVKTGYVAGVL
jgi:dienelactone hydrolase